MKAPVPRVTIDPEICNRKPTISGKRITVQTILEILAAGDSKEVTRDQKPTLDKKDISAISVYL